MNFIPLLAIPTVLIFIGLGFLISVLYSRHLRNWHNIYSLTTGGHIPGWVLHVAMKKHRTEEWWGGILTGKSFLYDVLMEHDQSGNIGITRVNRKLI